jgi:26S proteasome regulatory subunit N7
MPLEYQFNFLTGKSLAWKSHNKNANPRDLSKFVPQKRLNCVIDRVNGIIVTNRPDNKNAQYQQLVKHGDALLTKLQKYGAAVRLSGAERVA